MPPLEAALKGAGEIGFTIVSISVSLVAVFIPLLLMGGIVGRLFREFAVTRHHDHRRLGLRLADADADDVRAVPARREARRARPRCTWSSSAASTALLGGYTRGLDFVLRHQRVTLLVFFATVAATVVLYVDRSQGLLPAAGHRHHRRPLRGRAGHLVRRRWCAGSTSSTDVIAQRSRRRRAAAPALGGSRPINNGIRHHRPEAARRAQGQRRPDHHPAAAEARRGHGRDLLPAGGPGPQRRRPHYAHPVPVHAAGPGPRRAQRLGAEAARRS